MIRRYLNGETRRRKPPSSYTKYIGIRREPGELKHLSSRRKRKQQVILEVAASETERAQTGVRALRGSDRIIVQLFEVKRMGIRTRESESLVTERRSCEPESRVPRDTGNLVGIRGDHPVRLNTPQ